MKPVNSKSLLAFVFGQMEKLDKNEIDVNQAKAQALLAKQANNILRYELDLVSTKIELDSHNKSSNTNIELRNVESINFK